MSRPFLPGAGAAIFARNRSRLRNHLRRPEPPKRVAAPQHCLPYHFPCIFSVFSVFSSNFSLLDPDQKMKFFLLFCFNCTEKKLFSEMTFLKFSILFKIIRGRIRYFFLDPVQSQKTFPQVIFTKFKSHAAVL